MRKSEHEKLTEVMETQNAIINIQSKVIDELFLLLMQHIGTERADRLPCVSQINEAARLRENLGWDGEEQDE